MSVIRLSLPLILICWATLSCRVTGSKGGDADANVWPARDGGFEGPDGTGNPGMQRDGAVEVGADGDPVFSDGDPIFPDGGGDDGGVGTPPTEGCGRAFEGAEPGYVTISSGRQERQFFLSVAPGYDRNKQSAVYFGVHGRDYDGRRMRSYLGLEAFAAPGEIFVYPDGLQRDWDGLGLSIGWQNGPATDWLGGTEDLDFMDDILDYLTQRFCVDEARVFVTGQSWGGDFSNVIGCYLGDRFRAFVSVAANTPYYLPIDRGPACVGSVAAWVMHGKGDAYFPVAMGEEVRDFWLAENACPDGARSAYSLDQGAQGDDDCFEYLGCTGPTRYCSYTSQAGHQVPRGYYSRETMAFFHDFL